MASLYLHSVLCDPAVIVRMLVQKLRLKILHHFFIHFFTVTVSICNILLLSSAAVEDGAVQCPYNRGVYTWNVFVMAKMYWKTISCRLTDNTPNNQVTPSSGLSTATFHAVALQHVQ